jgi:hypothetical protein
MENYMSIDFEVELRQHYGDGFADGFMKHICGQVVQSIRAHREFGEVPYKNIPAIKDSSDWPYNPQGGSPGGSLSIEVLVGSGARLVLDRNWSTYDDEPESRSYPQIVPPGVAPRSGPGIERARFGGVVANINAGMT